MVNAQTWLEQNYPEKNQVKIIEIVSKVGEEEVEGELIISDFPQLEEIKKKTEGEKSITKLTINNCPQLRRINCYFCWKIQELIITNCPQVSELNCDTNQIENLELSELTALTRLNCSNNRLTGLDVSNNQKLKYLACEKNKIKELDLGNNPEITFLDSNDNPLDHNPYFFSQKQKDKLKELQERANLSERLLTQTLEENEKMTADWEARLEDLKFSLTEEQKALIQEEKNSQNLQQTLLALQTEMIKIVEQNEKLEKENQKLRERLFQREIQNKKKEVEQLTRVLKSNLNDEDDSEELDSLLEAQVEFIENHTSYAQKQVEKSKKKLLKNKRMEEKELNKLLQIQVEIIELKRESEKKGESLIEIPPK